MAYTHDGINIRTHLTTIGRILCSEGLGVQKTVNAKGSPSRPESLRHALYQQHYELRTRSFA
jgi:hypothetical protein